MSKLTSPCGHDVEDYIFNGKDFVCPVKEYDKGTVEECGTILKGS